MADKGRPTLYTPEALATAELMYLAGAIDKEVAHKLGIAEGTLYEWKKRYPDFSDASKKWKENADDQVEQSLLAKAKAGDTTAMIFWLKNRKRDQWRDRVDVNHSGNFAGLTDEQIDEKLAELEAKLKGQKNDR